MLVQRFLIRKNKWSGCHDWHRDEEHIQAEFLLVLTSCFHCGCLPPNPDDHCVGLQGVWAVCWPWGIITSPEACLSHQGTSVSVLLEPQRCKMQSLQEVAFWLIGWCLCVASHHKLPKCSRLLTLVKNDFLWDLAKKTVFWQVRRHVKWLN